VGRKYDDSFLEIKKFENMSDKERRYFRLIQKLRTFYVNKELRNLKKDISDGKLVSKEDLKKSLFALIDYTCKTLKTNLTSETQLKKLSKQVKKIDIKSILKKQSLASLYEVAYSNLEDTDKSLKIFQLEIKKYLEKKILIKKNETREVYIEKIITFLDIDEFSLKYLLDEIKYSCEFEKVIIAIKVSNEISELPKRDRKKLYEEKRKFERLIKLTIDNLKKLNLSYDEVEKKEFISPESLGWHNYETTLKHYKSILFYSLTNDCGTGKQRANSITKIFDYL